MADFEFHLLNQTRCRLHRLQKLFKPPVIVQQFADKFQMKALPQSLHFARKTDNPWAGLKTDSRSAAGRWTARSVPDWPPVVGSGGRLQRPAGVEYYHVDYVGRRKRFYSAVVSLFCIASQCGA